MWRRRLAVCLLVGALAAPGCATVRRVQASDREDLLLASGFQKKLAETEAQRAQIDALPARMLVRVPFGAAGDEVRYVWADPDYCRCLMAGTESAYEEALAAVTQEIVARDTADASTLEPQVSPRQMERYEQMARESILDPTPDHAVDWPSWGAWGDWR